MGSVGNDNPAPKPRSLTFTARGVKNAKDKTTLSKAYMYARATTTNTGKAIM